MLEDDNSRDRDRDRGAHSAGDMEEEEEEETEADLQHPYDTSGTPSLISSSPSSSSIEVKPTHIVSDSAREGTGISDLSAPNAASSSSSAVCDNSAPLSVHAPVQLHRRSKASFVFRTVIPVLMALLEPPEMSRVEK